MAIRDLMYKYQFVSTIAAALAVVVGISLIVMQAVPKAGPGAIVVKGQFYTDDDGKTWFVDSQYKFPPFDHNGKTAAACLVYKTATGEPFVGYMMMYNKATKAKLEAAMNNGGENAVDAFIQDNPNPNLVKKPNEPKWVAFGSKAGNVVTTVASPDGAPIAIQLPQ